MVDPGILHADPEKTRVVAQAEGVSEKIRQATSLLAPVLAFDCIVVSAYTSLNPPVVSVAQIPEKEYSAKTTMSRPRRPQEVESLVRAWESKEILTCREESKQDNFERSPLLDPLTTKQVSATTHLSQRIINWRIEMIRRGPAPIPGHDRKGQSNRQGLVLRKAVSWRNHFQQERKTPFLSGISRIINSGAAIAGRRNCMKFEVDPT